jgi:hypothetical protein
MRLKLPPGAETEKMLEKHVVPVFKNLQLEKLPTACIAINEPGAELTIRYDANRHYGGGSYPSYTAACPLTRNPVYAKLKAKVSRRAKDSCSPNSRKLPSCLRYRNSRRKLEVPQSILFARKWRVSSRPPQ